MGEGPVSVSCIPCVSTHGGYETLIRLKSEPDAANPLAMRSALLTINWKIPRDGGSPRKVPRRVRCVPMEACQQC